MADLEKKVLVIDDNIIIRKIAVNLLSKNDYRIFTAEDGRKGIELAKLFFPDVILLDVMMPKMDGYEVCEILKNDDMTKDIPIIMISSKTETIDKIQGLEKGAADYITKPFEHAELQARVATQIKMKNLWDELQEKNNLLEELVKKDGLTNLYNHRYFQECISHEFARSQRYKFPLSCVLIDIDHFKMVNDTYGHQTGDEILKSLSLIFKEVLREVDVAARYGGEEFALLLPHTIMEDATVLCQRFKEIVESRVFHFKDTDINITISQGVAGMPNNRASSHSELIRYADEALYTAKDNGRNRVEICNKK